MLKLILIFTLLISTIEAPSQQPTKNISKISIKISVVKGEHLFLNILNMVSIKTSPKTKDSLIIKVSQGDILMKDKDDIYYIQAAKIGDLTIKVYKFVNNETQLLIKKTFRVELTEQEKIFKNLSRKPDISLNGYLHGKIPVDTLRAVRCLTINPSYKFVSAEIYISGCTAFSDGPYKLKSICFDKHFLNIWSRISPGTTIVFDNLNVIDLTTKKKYYIPTMNYLVKDNKL